MAKNLKNSRKMFQAKTHLDLTWKPQTRQFSSSNPHCLICLNHSTFPHLQSIHICKRNN